MDIKELTKSWKGVKNLNLLLHYANIGLVICVLLLSFLLMKKQSVTTLIPPGLNKEVEVGYDFASTSYLDVWSLHVALSLGNVSPGTVSFIKAGLEPILSAKIYQQVMNALEKQVSEIRASNVTLFFEPRSFFREPGTNKTFVYGVSVMEAPSGVRTRSSRTYELEFEVKNYMPSLTYISTYSGEPRTAEVIAKEKEQG